MNAIKQHSGEIHKASTSEDLLSAQCIENLFKVMSTNFDGEMGGYGGAPKFPQVCELKITL